MIPTRLLVAILMALSSPACTFAGDGQGSDTRDVTVRVTVPQSLAAQAARRTRGDTDVPVPILVLEGVEVGADEGLRIRVLGPASGPSAPRPLFGSASLVGSPQSTLQPPLTKMTFSVPMTNAALPFLTGESEIELSLHVDGEPGRPPLHVERIFFKTPSRP